MKKNMSVIVFIFLFIVILNSEEIALTWQLPVNIGDDRFTVYLALGIPNEVISRETLGNKFDWPQDQTNEYFYANGIIVIFLKDKVNRIVVNSFVDYTGWKDYTGNIINEVSLLDNRQKLILKLGKPFIMKTDPIYKTDSDEFGFPLYSNSYYTWIMDKYRIEIEVANTDQVIDSNNNTVRPQDGINTIAITENKK